MFMRRGTGIIVAVFFLFIIGCEKSADVVNPINDATSTGANRLMFAKTGADVQNAVFSIYVGGISGQEVRIHEITKMWGESTVTWSNFGGSYNSAIIASFTASARQWYSTDITDLVRNWYDNPASNFGILLEQGHTNPTVYSSSEYAYDIARPKLEILYTDGTSMMLQQNASINVEDSYIWEISPYSNYGNSPELITGLVNGWEKQSLIKFIFPDTPQGCTLTPGYWKTHSSYGPASYDPTWAYIGEDTPFFLSGKTYYQVLWKEPAGNAYYILAHAYIATELNRWSGAGIPVIVVNVFDQADGLLTNYTPAQIAVLKGKNALRQDFLDLATILDDFNNGLYSQHCD